MIWRILLLSGFNCVISSLAGAGLGLALGWTGAGLELDWSWTGAGLDSKGRLQKVVR
jgi:hypothetical protein